MAARPRRWLEGVDVVVNLGGRSIAHAMDCLGTGGDPRPASRGPRSSPAPSPVWPTGRRPSCRPPPSGTTAAPAGGEAGRGLRPGEGFLAEVVRDWEDATTPAREAGLRVALPARPALSDGGGSPGRRRSCRCSSRRGGRPTARDAAVSWISLDDMVRAYAHVILSSTADGPLNAVAPGTVTAGEFARTLGRVLHRPALLPVPRCRTGARARPRRGRRADPHRPGRLDAWLRRERLRACSPRARARAAPPAAADADEGEACSGGAWTRD